jgi:hypothetical protein
MKGLPVYADWQNRTHLSNTMPEFKHLQILHDKDVERKILDIIPQIDNWLDGTLPLPKEAETSPEDPGVIFPKVEIDIPLRPIRDLIYSGVRSRLQIPNIF